MTFTTAAPKTPTRIRRIDIRLTEIPEVYSEGEATTVREVQYELEVLDATGDRIRVLHDAGDLIPHLTDTQKAGLLQFMADIRTKAEAELLP